MVDPTPGHLTGYGSSVWGVGFRHWVGGVLREMRRKSPVQQWIDSIPNAEQPTTLDDLDSNEAPPFRDDGFNYNRECDAPQLSENPVDNVLAKKRSKGVLLRDRSTNSEGTSPRRRHPFLRDSSVQSESAGSRCSSVESLLESRRVDAEAVLRGVGFGPSPARQQLARIPDRFLKPSKLNGVDTEKFIKDEQKSMKMHECGVFGYRGLTGHPHVPPSTIVAKIIERISSCDELPETSCYLQAIQRSDIDNFY